MHPATHHTQQAEEWLENMSNRDMSDSYDQALATYSAAKAITHALLAIAARLEALRP